MRKIIEIVKQEIRFDITNLSSIELYRITINSVILLVFNYATDISINNLNKKI